MTYSGPANFWLIAKKINQFIEIMQELALSVRTLQSRAGISKRNPKTTIAPAISDLS